MTNCELLITVSLSLNEGRTFGYHALSQEHCTDTEKIGGVSKIFHAHSAILNSDEVDASTPQSNWDNGAVRFSYALCLTILFLQSIILLQAEKTIYPSSLDSCDSKTNSDSILNGAFNSLQFRGNINISCYNHRLKGWLRVVKYPATICRLTEIYWMLLIFLLHTSFHSSCSLWIP